jgi:sugar phosphate isomerase/epimerase
MISRRNFIKISGGTVGAMALASSIPTGLMGNSAKESLSLGFQVWTIREQLCKDFQGTLKMMAGLGYKELEMCSPLGYAGTGFEVFKDMSGTEMRKIIEQAGLVCRSSHFNMGELRSSLENRIEWAHQMGMSQMIASSFWLPEGASIDDYRKACDELNEIGLKTGNAGIQLGFHNHNMEFEMRNNELIYDALIKELDPKVVKMQFQVAVIEQGYKAADYFRKYPGRFISAHLADWSNEKKSQVPIGQGVVDWTDFFEAAKIGGVKNFFVEMDPETFKESASFLLKK